MATTVELENIKEMMQKIRELQVTNPAMNKQVKTIMRSAIKDAVKDVRKDAKGALKNDPRKAYMAVRSAVYKKILGGQVNILSRRTNNGKMYVGEKVRTLKPGQRGGNRRPVSGRTKQIEGYYGSDRGFILRFINAGTQDRMTKYGNRGKIGGESWFKPSGEGAMKKAVEKFSELFDRAIVELWNKE